MSIGVVATREFTERVRSRWFVISTFFIPVLIATGLLVPTMIGRDFDSSNTIYAVAVQGGDPESIAVLGESANRIRISTLGPEVDSHLRLVQAGAYDVVIDLAGPTAGLVHSNLVSEAGLAEARSLVERLLMLREVGVRAPSTAPVLETSVEVDGMARESQLVIAYGIWILLYMAITVYAVRVMGSIVSEKANRIVDLLVTKVRPFDLLTGKILGVGSVGLVQMGIWLVSLLLVGVLVGDGLGGSLLQVDLMLAGIVLMFFLLGYFLYASLFATIAAVAADETDARQMQLPIIVLLIAPSWLIIAAINDPYGLLSILLSYLPFWSPMGMPVRWAVGTATPLEVSVSAGVLAASMIMGFWMSGRIYRIGILSRGKRPGFFEVLRWLRSG